MNIETHEQLRSAAALLSSNITAICNSNNLEDICNKFVEAKDLLINIYRYKVENLQK